MHGFQVRTPICHIVPVSHAYLPPPPRTVCFPPPSGVSALFFPYKNPRQSKTRSSFGGVQKFSGERVLSCVFLPAYVLHPPISRPKTQKTLLKCRTFSNFQGDGLLNITQGGPQMNFWRVIPCLAEPWNSRDGNGDRAMRIAIPTGEIPES